MNSEASPGKQLRIHLEEIKLLFSSVNAMADCMQMTYEDFIEAGIITKDVPPMMLSDAVILRYRDLEAKIKRLEKQIGLSYGPDMDSPTDG